MVGQGAGYNRLASFAWRMWARVYGRPGSYRAFSWLATRFRMLSPSKQGGWTAARRLRAARVPMNQGFGGVYGFDAPDAAAYGAHMARWLPQMARHGLVMCHPAAGVVHGDAIGAQRPVEFAYLMSADFGALLARHQLHIHQGPLRGVLPCSPA